MVEAEVVHSDSNKQLIDTLRRSKLFRRYEQVFSEATGLPLTLRPVDYWQLEHDGKKHQNRFCAMLAERPATLAVCLQAHQDIIDHTGLIPHTVTCPVRVNRNGNSSEHSGPRSSDTCASARCCVTRRRNRTAQKSAANWSGTECDSRARFAKHGRKLRSFHQTNTMPPCDCSHFSPNNSPHWLIKSSWSRAIQNRLLFSKRASISRSIRSEELSLADAAKAAGASVFHFCKVFHKATGLKFTDYVARMRLEDARNRLLNPNLRISEIAYDVGFQSLTQFNRTFKRVFGQSPTEFRARVSSGRRVGKSI